MEAFEPFLSLGLAIGAGLLIGLEREQSQDPDREHGPFIGGVRTFPLFALLGCLSVLLRSAGVSWLPLAAFCGVVVFVAISYADDVRQQRDRGLTTEGAILVTFLLGALAPARDVIEPTSRRVLVVAALQKRYAIARDEAQRQIDDWAQRLKHAIEPKPGRTREPQ